MRAIITNSYTKLFQLVPEANTMSRDDLFNDFVNVYHLSPRLARTAVPAFLFLCKLANMAVSEEISARPRTRTKKLNNFSKANISTPSFFGNADHPQSDTSGAKFDFNGATLVCTSPEWLKKLAMGELKPVIEILERLKNEIKNQNQNTFQKNEGTDE